MQLTVNLLVNLLVNSVIVMTSQKGSKACFRSNTILLLVEKTRLVVHLGVLEWIYPWIYLNGLFNFCAPWNCQKIIDFLIILRDGWNLTGLLELI